MRRILLATGMLALSAPLPASAGGGCHQPGVAEAATARIAAKYNCFSPAVSRVAPGTTVTWVNEDGHDHNVAGQAESLGFNDLRPGQTVAIRFARAGTYPYSCTLHPGMIGAVVVGDGKSDGAQPVVEVVDATPTPAADTVALTTDTRSWTDNTAAVGGAGAGLLGLGVAAGFAFARRRPGDA